jgi:gliding motility-associated-like protein
VFCDGESVFLKIDSLTGNPPFSYNWSNGEVTDSILVGSGTYELVLTDIDNCALTKSITINSLTKPTAFLSGEAVKCFNSDEELSLNFEFTGELPIIVNYGLVENQFIDTVDLFNYQIKVTEAGNYSIFQLKDNNCSGTFSGQGVLTESNDFNSRIIGSKNICEGEEVTLEINVEGLNPPYNILLNNNSYNVSINDVTTNPYLLTVTDTVIYTVVYVESPSGCRSGTNVGAAKVAYKVLNEPNILPPDQVNFCQVDSAIQLFADLGGGSWSGKGITSEGVFVLVDAFEGEGWIYYTYPENCNEGDSVLFVVGCDYALFFPSVFTPNGDGINDFFTPQGYNILEYKLEVFDRWGSLLFSTNDMTISWDGRFKGRKVPTGNYVYHANFFAKNAKYYNKNGSIRVVY